jgi:hypothetical protein
MAIKLIPRINRDRKKIDGETMFDSKQTVRAINGDQAKAAAKLVISEKTLASKACGIIKLTVHKQVRDASAQTAIVRNKKKLLRGKSK